MFENVRIEVTAEHIAKGVREDCHNCPIALALKDAIPLAKNVSVGPDINFSFDGAAFEATDEDAEEWACLFDEGEEVQPRVFCLEFEATDFGDDDDDEPCTLPVIQGGKVD